jgi:hypothetical protein
MAFQNLLYTEASDINTLTNKYTICTSQIYCLAPTYFGLSLQCSGRFYLNINTFAAIVDLSRFNNSCLTLLKISDDNE